ncbi:hypothetical protein AAMO2058_000410400 [Amorphochlora amoebiformis]
MTTTSNNVAYKILTSQPSAEDTEKKAAKQKRVGNRIVILVDEETIGKKVIDFCAKKLIKKDEDEISLLHCYSYEPVPIMPHAGMTFDYPSVNAELLNQAKTKAEALMKCLVSHSATLGLKPKKYLVLGNERVGSAVKYDIEEFISSNLKDVTMIVSGSRGMGAMGRAFLGSVTDYLVHNLKKTMVVVKC